MNPEDVVRSFCEAWSRRDIDELLGYFTEDAVYHNIPIDPVKGKDGIRAVLQMFVPPAQEISFEILAQVADGDVVMNERVDRFTIGDKRIELPVAGVFEVKDGKIAAWRDYFDMQAWVSQTSG